MKKNKWLVCLTAVMLLLSLLTATAALADKAAAPVNAAITEEQARKIALENAELLETDVTFIKLKLERDDGVTQYELKFYDDTTEYDYSIDASTGEILSFENETGFDPNAAAASGTMIDDAAALTNALTHAGITESDVTRLKVKLDEDDGKVQYEIKFAMEKRQYSYDIDAYTGKITGYEVEKN